LLGDVVLCPVVAERQAATAGHSTEAELHLLCTHGVLHLLGYDHGDAATEQEMFGTQSRLLASWATARNG
jgi:probable rRNA maturation factor